MIHTTAKLYIGSINCNFSGKRNSNNPVALFKIVCKAMSFFLLTNPKIILITAKCED